ncbi:MAG: family 16 glycoside hydrolase [Candidatus Hydrogenedentes bacterium]|nr:family 16 glycoside hydrolase [Candidatus Hydrogenedentota bacterium]
MFNSGCVRKIFAIILMTGVAAIAQEKNAITVQGVTLKRGAGALTLQAIMTPDAAKPGTTKEQVAAALNQVAAPGANAICFDVYGIAEDGESISQEAIDAVRQVRAVGADRGAVGVVRLFGPHAPQDRKARLAWAQTAARTFKEDSAYLFLFDGDDAGKLVRAFKKSANDLATASPRYGDVDIVAPGNKTRKKPFLILGGLPEELGKSAHFILSADQTSYDALDAASALPEESQRWTPDNSGLSPEERAEGFIALFDGKTLNGWVVMGEKKDAWVVKDGMIVRESGGSAGVRTVRRFANYVMRWEWNLPKGGNNGVHMRAPRAQRASKVGYEYQMLGDYGEEPNKNSTGSIYDVVGPTSNASKPIGEWNSSEAIFDGTRITYYLNGVKVNDVDINDVEELRPRARSGFIVLTEHSDPVMYRNIRIKELP